MEESLRSEGKGGRAGPEIKSLPQGVYPAAGKMGNDSRQKRGKNKGIGASRGPSKGEDEPLVCGSKVTSNWRNLFSFLSPSHMSFVLYPCGSTVVRG